jgi:hypothetical protein
VEHKNKNADRKDNNVNCLIKSTRPGFHYDTWKQEKDMRHLTGCRHSAPLPGDRLPQLTKIVDKKRPASWPRGIWNSATDRFIIDQMMTTEWATFLGPVVFPLIVKDLEYIHNQNVSQKNFDVLLSFVLKSRYSLVLLSVGNRMASERCWIGLNLGRGSHCLFEVVVWLLLGGLMEGHVGYKPSLIVVTNPQIGVVGCAPGYKFLCYVA